MIKNITFKSDLQEKIKNFMILSYRGTLLQMPDKSFCWYNFRGKLEISIKLKSKENLTQQFQFQEIMGKPSCMFNSN